jgi:hypothetical protein
LNTKNILLTLVIVICFAVSAFRIFNGKSTNPRQRRDLADDLAAVIAKEASSGAKGALLILAPLDEKRDPFPGQLARSAERQMRQAGFNPVEVERVPFNTALEFSGEPVAHDVFLDLLKAHSGANVVLSLVGVPRLTDSDLPAANRPRIIVASTAKMPYLRSLPPGMIDFALEVRQKIANGAVADSSLGELSNYFVLYRPQ